MKILDVRDFIIAPALNSTGLGSADAIALMTCTGYQETRYNAVRQHPGPALGLWQIEPVTHQDIKRELKRADHRMLCERIISACYMTCFPLDDDILIWNLRYSVLIARMVYYRHGEKLPSQNDPVAMATYYCKYYNVRGKAKLTDVINLFTSVLNECRC